MNMSSPKLDRLTTEFPEESAAIQRLVQFLEKFQSDFSERESLSIRRLFDVAHPSSQAVLARILQRLVEERVLKQIVRVESETLGGIKDFPSIVDVPRVIHDWRRDVEVEVRPENIRLYYKLENNNAGQ